MKKYIKEIVLIIIHIFCLYCLPLIARFISKDAMILILFLNMIITFIISIIIGALSKSKIKYLYPLIVAILYIPSMYIFYNEFIFIYLVFHFIFSITGIFIGNAFLK